MEHIHTEWLFQMKSYIKNAVVPCDFPGDPMVKNPPANAGDMGSIPGLERFPHAVKQLLSPMRPNARLCKKRSYHSKKPAYHLESSSHLLQLGKAHVLQ